MYFSNSFASILIRVLCLYSWKYCSVNFFLYKVSGFVIRFYWPSEKALDSVPLFFIYFFKKLLFKINIISLSNFDWIPQWTCVDQSFLWWKGNNSIFKIDIELWIFFFFCLVLVWVRCVFSRNYSFHLSCHSSFFVLILWMDYNIYLWLSIIIFGSYSLFLRLG